MDVGTSYNGSDPPPPPPPSRGGGGGGMKGNKWTEGVKSFYIILRNMDEVLTTANWLQWKAKLCAIPPPPPSRMRDKL